MAVVEELAFPGDQCTRIERQVAGLGQICQRVLGQLRADEHARMMPAGSEKAVRDLISVLPCRLG